MLDDAAVLLGNSGQETRHVFEDDQRDIEAITEAHKPRTLDRAVYVQNPGEVSRLISNNADRPAIKTRKPHNDVRSILAMHFKEVTVIDNQIDHFTNIIRLVRSLRND